MDAALASRTALTQLVAEEPIDLARAALAIAREEYPGLDESRWLRRLDELAVGARIGLPSDASDDRKVGRLGVWLFREQGFAGNSEQYEDPKNSFLNEVLEHKQGIPITLSLVYLEVGRRFGLTVDGIGFPGHFLCRVQVDHGELYVDPFHRGQILGQSELAQRWRAAVGKLPFDMASLRPARPREILVRMLQNLLHVYRKRGDLPRALSAVDRMLLLHPDHPRGLRDRADLYEKLGGSRAAAADLERVLELSPAAQDKAALEARIAALRGTVGVWN
ncbi:MAG: transglutaminase family protein [Deltaproteobacteria bacterium]|nr:transglutaminase family protein [Deltaproteobacteria bacterium]